MDRDNVGRPLSLSKLANVDTIVITPSIDAATLAAARADITGFVSRLEKHAILDEVQRVPELLPLSNLLLMQTATPCASF